MTVVSGRSSDSASCVSAAVLPMPGSPHSRTGRSRGDGQGERLELFVGPRLTGTGPQEGQECFGDAEFRSWGVAGRDMSVLEVMSIT